MKHLLAKIIVLATMTLSLQQAKANIFTETITGKDVYLKIETGRWDLAADQESPPTFVKLNCQIIPVETLPTTAGAQKEFMHPEFTTAKVITSASFITTNPSKEQEAKSVVIIEATAFEKEMPITIPFYTGALLLNDITPQKNQTVYQKAAYKTGNEFDTISYSLTKDQEACSAY